MQILIGYDGSPFADAALDDLPQAALPPDVNAVVLCAADVFSPPPAAPTDTPDPQIATLLDASRRDAEQALADARAVAERGAARVRSTFPGWRVTAETVADPAGWALVKRAENLLGLNWRADLVILGSAGHSAIRRVFFGSVAHQVLTRCRCSVRIGRKPDRADPAAPLQIIVGVDGSADSAAAVRAVAARRWPPHTTIRVVTVVDSRLLAAFMPPVLPIILAPAVLAERVANDAASVLRAAGLNATTTIRQGGAARVLTQVADELHADGVFLGACGLSRVERFFLGSVAASVAMRAACSVEIVQPA